MVKVWTIIIAAIIALVGLGVIYLMSVDIQPPSSQVVKTIPDSQFPK